jgi:hypothetical protein
LLTALLACTHDYTPQLSPGCYSAFKCCYNTVRYDFPKDTKKDLEDGIQKLTDGFVKKLDEMIKAKSDDIMKV